ncbi:MAG: hypothetical protein FWC75_00570 [Oscillospiraceae bacterium]|nr:hypothetical protein [Oscillospiraceae bacterium]
MNRNKLSTALIFLVPQILELIMTAYKVDDESAAEMLYASELYKGLEEEETKLWHLSAHALFEMYQEERDTGKITYPEEA